MQNILRTYLTTLILTLVASSLAAQVMMPSAKSNRSKMLIGEQAVVTLSLELQKPNEWPKIQFPYLQDELTEGLEILDVTPVDTTNPNAGEPHLYQLSQRYTVTAFDSGLYVVKPFVVLVNGDSLFSNRLQFAIQTVAVDTTQMTVFDIKEIYEVNLTLGDYLALYGWLVLLLLFGGAAIVLLWYFLKKRKRVAAVTEEIPEPKIPAHIIAFEALAALEKEKPWLKGDLKKYHSDLTDILRDYLEERFLIPAHEQTSNEILQQMRFTELPNDAMLRLRHVLKLADMVKFAKEKPEAADNERSLHLTKEFVSLTIPQEKPEQPSQNSAQTEQQHVER